jgi:hypothetical protein
LKFFSDAFLKLISMIVAPIVFYVVVHGIAGAGDLKKVGRVGGNALAVSRGHDHGRARGRLILTYVIRPGVGMNINTANLDAHALSAYADNAHRCGGFLTAFDPEKWGLLRDGGATLIRALAAGTPPSAMPSLVPGQPRLGLLFCGACCGDPNKEGDLWQENWKARLPS